MPPNDRWEEAPWGSAREDCALRFSSQRFVLPRRHDQEAVESFVDWLLSLTPVRLLVTTRRRPGWATARRVLYGEVTEIGRDDLAMTREEAAGVLKTCRAGKDPREERRLEKIAAQRADGLEFERVLETFIEKHAKEVKNLDI